MKNKNDAPSTPVRILPGIILLALQYGSRFGLPLVDDPLGMQLGMMGGLVFGLGIFIWWVFFSRIPSFERWGAFLLATVLLILTPFALHESIRTAQMGLAYFFHAIPTVSFVLVAWAVARRFLSLSAQRISLAAIILIACGASVFFRSAGMDGDGNLDVRWRWSATSEARLLSGGMSTGIASKESAGSGLADWPGFRGPQRDGSARGLRIRSDWNKNPPALDWRRAVGPGCSSFAARGEFFFTQEQRGENELVSCYRLSDGTPVWTHADKARFWDSHAGAGPRATPTLSGERMYALGGTGLLNALDPRDGRVIWKRDLAAELGVKAPHWGFSASPLVVGDVVIAALAGKMAAFHAATGAPRWTGIDGSNGYSSPHAITLQGVEQVLHMNQSGALAVSPESGAVLWQFPLTRIDRILQPYQMPGGDLLLMDEEFKGLRRVSVRSNASKWSVTPRWYAEDVKLYFNDFVVHKGHAFVFDNAKLACVNLENGKRAWRGERRDQGWLLLVADDDLLIVLSEKGELSLTRAAADRFEELGRFKALAGKTWNHPALAGNLLLVRNAEEMAAYRL
jgi:outer membrane protein assembly factor BamB